MSNFRRAKKYTQPISILIINICKCLFSIIGSEYILYEATLAKIMKLQLHISQKIENIEQNGWLFYFTMKSISTKNHVHKMHTMDKSPEMQFLNKLSCETYGKDTAYMIG